MSLAEILKKCYNKEISDREAFSMIAEALRTIEESKVSDKKEDVYESVYVYTNEKEYLDKVIDVYSLVVLNNDLTKLERGVLKYYLKNGYSDRVKQSIKKDFNVTSQHLNQLNWKLKEKGFLDNHSTNQRSKVVSPELINLRDAFDADGKNLNKYLITFEKDR